MVFSKVDKKKFKDEEDYQGYLRFIEKIGEQRAKTIDRVGKISKSWKQYPEPKVADLKYYQTLEGEGIRHTIYVSGCLFNCRDCYNKRIQIQSEGYTLTKEMENEFLSELNDPLVDGVTLVGGEPLMSAKLLLPLTERIRREHPSKTIWIYTGYLTEDILDMRNTQQFELFSMADVVVDGQFITELRDEANLKPFRGSSNQRLVDVKSTLDAGSVRLYNL